MRLTTKHYVDLGGGAGRLGGTLLSPRSWDSVRLDGSEDTPFAIPADRATWIERCMEDASIIRRAEEVVSLARSLGAKRLYSLGIGCAWLEYNIKRVDSSLHLSCTDFAPRTIERLRSVFVECDQISQFDILNDEFPRDPHMYILHRIDTELADRDWEGVFSKISRSGVRYVLFIPSGLLGPRTWVREQARVVVSWMRRRRMVFAGYLRTEARFESLWSGSYRRTWVGSLGGLRGFLLEPI